MLKSKSFKLNFSKLLPFARALMMSKILVAEESLAVWLICLSCLLKLCKNLSFSAFLAFFYFLALF